jgi:hypothetical protein
LGVDAGGEKVLVATIYAFLLGLVAGGVEKQVHAIDVDLLLTTFQQTFRIDGDVDSSAHAGQSSVVSVRR